MFDYKTLVTPVRLLLGDTPATNSEEVPSFQNDSYRIVLSEEGYATIISVTIDGVELDPSQYSVEENIITFNDIVSAGSEVSIQYKSQKYSDEVLLEYIGNTIRYYIQPLCNTDYGFGEGGYSETQTGQKITPNESGLFVHGTVLNVVGINLLEVSGDAIYIRDGDTTIDTKVASQEAGNSYRHILSRFNYLFKTVRTNTFQGVVITGA